MSREAVVLITLVIYKIALVAIGLWTERRTKDGADFFVGGRQLGPTVAAISASASSSSAWTLLGVSGAAYADGLSAIWLFPACVGGFCINWYVLAPALRRYGHATQAVTVTDVLARDAAGRRNRAIATVAALIIVFSLGAYIASQYQAAGKSFASNFELDFDTSVLIGAGVVLLYTLLGGFWAVSVTDTLQGMVMAATALVLPIAGLIAVGGPVALFEQLAAHAPEGYLSLTKPGPTSLVIGGVLGLLGIGLGYPGQPHVANRFIALRAGASELRTARRMALGWAVIVYAGMLLVGFCAQALELPSADKETAMFVLMDELFPPVLVGIMLAAVLSAVMSTADSQLLVAASAVAHDLELGGTEPRTMLRRSRITVAIVGVLAVVVALQAEPRIFKNVLFAWSAMGAAFGPLLLVLIVMGRQLAMNARLLVMLTGFMLSVAAYIASSPDYAVLTPGLRFFWSGFVAFASTFVLALALSRRAAPVSSD